MNKAPLVAAIGAAALLATGCTTQTDEPVETVTDAADLSGTVAFLTPSQTVVRWTQFDLPGMEAALEELAPDLEIKVYNAQDDATKQVQQAEAAITAGAKGIIMTAVDPDQTAAITSKAQDAGIPVVAYAHEANNSDPDYYVTVPFDQIGEESATQLVEEMKPDQNDIRLAKIYGDPSFFFYSQQAKGHDEVLQPYIEDGAIDVVCEADSIAYDTNNARRAMEQCLTQVGDDLDAVLVTNDSTANGVIAALASEGLLGRVKVFGGYDAEAGTIQHLLAGNISTDMRPPYEEMGKAAVEILVAELTGEEPPDGLVNGTYDNQKIEVPTAYLPNVLITPDNVQETLIDPGILTKKELCSSGPAVQTPFCEG